MLIQFDFSCCQKRSFKNDGNILIYTPFRDSKAYILVFKETWYKEGLLELQKHGLGVDSNPVSLKKLRSLSITNNLEILRDRLLREIDRKRSNAEVINTNILAPTEAQGVTICVHLTVCYKV